MESGVTSSKYYGLQLMSSICGEQMGIISTRILKSRSQHDNFFIKQNYICVTKRYKKHNTY